MNRGTKDRAHINANILLNQKDTRRGVFLGGWWLDQLFPPPWEPALQPKPAGPAGGPEVLLLKGKGYGRFDEAPRGLRTRQEVHIHTPDAVPPKLDVAGTRPAVSQGRKIFMGCW